jgi:RHS repeat-associated protein
MAKVGDAAASFAQTYDRDGNVTSESRSLTGVSGDAGSGAQTFTYDGVNRVTLASGLDQAQGFVYDHDSNRVAVATGTGSVSYTYDRTGQLVELSDGVDAEAFAYDAYGNLTGSATDFDTVTTYAYDPADRLLSITEPDSTLTTFTLDALGRHASFSTGSDTTQIAYLGTSETAWQLARTGSSAVNATVDADGSRLAIEAGAAAGFLLTDLHGNLAAAVNAADDAILSATRYDAYGSRAATYDAGGGFPSDWGFQGRLDISPDAANPLYEFSARFYAPVLGAFTQLDSYAGSAANVLSLNRYLYAAANPWTLIDPTGHFVPRTDDQTDLPDSQFKPGTGGGRVPPTVNPPPPPHVPEGPAGQSPVEQTADFRWMETDLDTYFGWDWQERHAYAQAYGQAAISMITSGKVEPFDRPVVLQLAEDYLCATDPDNCDDLRSWLNQYLDPADLDKAAAGADPYSYGWWAFYQEHAAGPSGYDGLIPLAMGFAAPAGAKMIGTPGGHLIPVPSDWVSFPARNRKGIIFQDPAYLGTNKNMIRIMDPTFDYPTGSLSIRNAKGIYVRPDGGVIRTRGDWHIDIGRYRGTFEWDL